MKNLLLILFLCSLFGVPVVYGQKADDLSSRCVSNMEQLWMVARHQYVLRLEIGLEPWDVQPRNLARLTVSVRTLYTSDSLKKCPSGKIYEDFFLGEGPKCSEGHKLSQQYIEYMTAETQCPTSVASCLARLTNTSPDIRLTAVWWASRSGFGSQDVRVILNTALTNDNAYVQQKAKQTIELLWDRERKEEQPVVNGHSVRTDPFITVPELDERTRSRFPTNEMKVVEDKKGQTEVKKNVH